MVDVNVALPLALGLRNQVDTSLVRPKELHLMAYRRRLMAHDANA